MPAPRCTHPRDPQFSCRFCDGTDRDDREGFLASPWRQPEARRVSATEWEASQAELARIARVDVEQNVAAA